MQNKYFFLFILSVFTVETVAQGNHKCNEEPSFQLKIYNKNLIDQRIDDAEIVLYFENGDEYKDGIYSDKGVACIEKHLFNEKYIFNVKSKKFTKERKRVFYEIIKDGFENKFGYLDQDKYGVSSEECSVPNREGYGCWTAYIEPKQPKIKNLELILSFLLGGTKSNKALIDSVKVKGLQKNVVRQDSISKNFMLTIPDSLKKVNIETYGYRSVEIIDSFVKYEKVEKIKTVLVKDTSTHPIKIIFIEKDKPEINIPGVKLSFLSHPIDDLYTNDYGEINIENLMSGIYVYKVHKPLKYNIEEDIGFFEIIPTSGDRPNEKVIALSPKQYTISGTITFDNKNINNFNLTKFEINFQGIDKTIKPIVSENGAYTISIPPAYFEQNNHSYTIRIEDENIETYQATFNFSLAEYNNRHKTANIQLHSKYQDYKFSLKGNIDRQVKFEFNKNDQSYSIWANPKPTAANTEFKVTGLVNYQEVIITDDYNGFCKSKKFRKKEIDRLKTGEALKLKKCKK